MVLDWFRLLLLLILLLGTVPVYSLDVIAWRAGVSGNIASYTVDDPNGSSGSSSAYSISPVAVFIYSNEWRLWTEVDYKKFDLDYGGNNIGQKVTSLGMEAVMQRGFGTSSSRFLLGGGVGFSKDTYKDRARVDQDGFVVQRYADRDEFNTALLLRGGYSHRIDNGSIGVDVGYQLPLNDGIRGFRVSFYWLFFGEEN